MPSDKLKLIKTLDKIDMQPLMLLLLNDHLVNNEQQVFYGNNRFVKCINDHNMIDIRIH